MGCDPLGVGRRPNPFEAVIAEAPKRRGAKGRQKTGKLKRDKTSKRMARAD